MLMTVVGKDDDDRATKKTVSALHLNEDTSHPLSIKAPQRHQGERERKGTGPKHQQSTDRSSSPHNTSSGSTTSSSNSSDDGNDTGDKELDRKSVLSPITTTHLTATTSTSTPTFTNYVITDLEGNYIRSVSICSMDSTVAIPTPSNTNIENLRFPAPYSMTFRIIHSSIHFSGSIFYFIAGPTYYPAIDNLFLGGICFTVGSLAFVIADSMDWWQNNRIGCFFDASYIDSYEERLKPYLEPDIHSIKGRIQRSQAGINAAISVLGSALYLVGSICYLPSILDVDDIMGTYLFIAGSLVVIIAQVWKISRNVIGNPIQYLDVVPETQQESVQSPSSTTNSSNGNEVFFVNWSVFVMDLWIACAAFCYLAGSFLFLPSYDTNNYDATEASNWFVFAGFFYCLGSVTMMYRYFYSKEY